FPWRRVRGLRLAGSCLLPDSHAPDCRGFAVGAANPRRGYRLTHQQPRFWRRANRVREGAAPVPADWCTRSATGGLRVAGAVARVRDARRVLAKLALMPGCWLAVTGVAARSATMSTTELRAMRSSSSISRWPWPSEMPLQWYSAASSFTSPATIDTVIRRI